MTIDINPNDIDGMVKDAILKASLGKIIQKALADVLAPSSYNNPVEAQLRTYITEVAGQLIRERFSEQVRAAVVTEVETRVTKEFIDTTVASTIEKMERAARDR